MILLYKGKSWVSRAIQWQTFGPYSHAAWRCADGSVMESWHRQTHGDDVRIKLKGGVQRHADPGTIHTPGTLIDVFDVPGIDRAAVECFLERQIGKDYDFAPVLRGFLFRVMRDNPDKWFCSELVSAACRAAGLPLVG